LFDFIFNIFVVEIGYLDEFMESQDYVDWQKELKQQEMANASKPDRRNSQMAIDTNTDEMPKSFAAYYPRVLVVDDSNITAKITLKLLQQSGYEVDQNVFGYMLSFEYFLLIFRLKERFNSISFYCHENAS
jgi:PleD family two-component response regulator